jgi:hypothetical protein
MLWYRMDLNRIYRYIPVYTFPRKYIHLCTWMYKLRKVYTLMYEIGHLYTNQGTFEYIAV